MLTLFIAPIGVGKTSHAVRSARKFWKKHPGSPVYTNIPELEGAYFIDIADTAKYRVYDKGTGYALYLLDEAGCGTTNNRNFKAFPTAAIEWIACHRHEHVDMQVYSQALDMDINFTRKCERIYTMKKIGPWTICRSWFRGKADTDLESGLPRFPWTPSPFPLCLSQTCYRPSWYKFFNSWWSPFKHLPDVPESRLIGSTDTPEDTNAPHEGREARSDSRSE